MKSSYTNSILILAGIGCVIALMLLITPSSEAVRVRNSLLFDIVTPQDLDWTPQQYPASFKLDTVSPPSLFQSFGAQIREAQSGDQSDFKSALTIGSRLGVGKVKGGAIQSDTVTTFQTILDEGTGYCADFTQVFNGLAHTLALPVREWGMSFDGFGGNGHAFNEIYDQALGKWVFIDTFYSFYVVDSVSDEPLSALEFRERLATEKQWTSIRVVKISSSRFAFPSDAAALEYYFRGVNGLYMYWGNNVFEYDDARIVRFAGGISRSAEQAVAILTGIHPRIHIPAFPENALAIKALGATRDKFVVILAIGIVISLILLYRTVGFIKSRRRRLTIASDQGD